jgi:hypothetical protein
MSVLGWILAVFGVAGIIFGIRMLLKLRKMTNVPFRKPSEIFKMGPAAADTKGLVSTEGRAEAPSLRAPMSGQPCLAYEYTIELAWEKEKVTERGSETEKGKTRLGDAYEGAKVRVSDEAGAVTVDLVKKPDARFEESFSDKIKVGNMVPAVLQFGQMEFQRQALPEDRRTVAFIGTERIIKVPERIYALGALKGTTIGEPEGALAGKLALSTEGREHLLKTTKRNQMLGFAIGAVLAVGGSALGIFGPKPTPSGASCADFTGAIECRGRMTERDGINYQWTVAQPGTYTLTVKMPAGLKHPIDPNLTVVDSAGKVVATNTGATVGADAVISNDFEPGVYRVNVRDFARSQINGGYSFLLSVKSPTTVASTK